MSIVKHIVKVYQKRIPLKKRNPKYFYYEIRHDDNNWEPATIEEKVAVNFWGTLVSKADLKSYMKDNYYALTDEDIDTLYEKIKTER